MKKIALFVYPDHSLQEVMNLSRLFRWEYDIHTEVISTELSPVRSEEGILLQPDKTVDDFHSEDYCCLILPGCSDFTQVWHNQKLFRFLERLRDLPDFPIGAICSAPLLLAKAGLLQGKDFTASIFMDFFDFLPCLEREHFQMVPCVTDGNITTAGGSNFTGFAVTMAKQLGYDCPDRILSGYMDAWTPEDYMQHLPPEALEETRAMFAGS